MELEKTKKLLGLRKLKDKLLNLSPLYNRKIRFYTSERLTWDLTELFANNDPKLIANFSSLVLNLLTNSEEKKENISFNLEPFFQPLTSQEVLKFQKKIIHLQKKNLAVQQEKGYKVLFLGVIFVRGYFYSNKNILRLVNAPLFLLPCNLEKVKNLSLVFESERKINYSLLYYLQKELGLAKEKITDFLSKLEGSDQKQMTTDQKSYLFFLNNELQQLVSSSQVKIKPLSVENNLAYLPTKRQELNNFFPEPFMKLTLKNKPENYPENQLEIASNFCLTIDDEPSLSLFRDFEKIIEEYSQDKGKKINWSQSALSLLKGETESVLSYPESKESSQPAKYLYTPFDSDPSQTRILKVIFQDFSENALCIDGPPGTGKSQLICNLLANALAYQKKVLVVCEKEVALKVLYDKLSEIGLSRSVIKINELAQTLQIYRDILNHLENNNQQERTKQYDYFNTKQIADLEEKQASNLRKIANYCKVENGFQNNHQISLQEVYLKFNRKHQLSPILVELNKNVLNRKQLETLKSDLENYISKFNRIFISWKSICLQLKDLFLNNFWEFEFNEDNRNNFQQLISSILKELEGKKTEINLLTRIWRANFFHEYSKIHNSSYLLETKLKELEELRAENNYQNFFAFLQVEKFVDFWQRCSDKEFLLTIQQFISEEFLTIGELHFALTKFSYNTRKNINYLLRKILLDQELNYLNSYKENLEQSIYFNWIKEVENENKEILANWNQDELIRIQQEQREITRRKSSLVKNILKKQQKENLNKLSSNQSIKNELSKKRRITSLKKLFPLLVDYFPIWLTTPKVIAAITNLQKPTFDFLVFDEASQMPLEKAIPLWARAKKCIVIGDEQQLPPTDFFKSHLETDEEIWEQEEEEKEKLTSEQKSLNLEIDDLEKNSNLLSYAKKYARGREKLTLLYHYRSKYPELIEFSNQAFYNGILQIVSASELKKKNYLPIEYHYQEKGLWINTENQTEARYIVDLLRTLSSDKEVGIITFNAKQRDLITDMIGEGHNCKNLFIKSLEEVQGDERDIIIFSVGYGPNEERKIRLNFGPLINEGGEKRLNVAISRAREKIIIVTSLLPSDLSRIVEEDENRKLGLKLFKKYLEYAYYCGEKQFEKIQEILEKSLPKIVNTSLYEKNEEQGEFGSLFKAK
ncbi:AAA domain-containing protein [endosymbiont GvMRE of Glomus versiforme]|uniref:AAA domain-containing protein n=1 Tax=endosymbiont GvMRE of Glomus versiforme TaxID=2039283 RepID=UPI000ECF9E5E|nr:AAA domain-containing protein [endosymbiont GvMRE of Glomus versiforme]RHZ35995.1 Superfamily i DNA helicase protein [endosymbiont GvMRE of Glomus versiforme]